MNSRTGRKTTKLWLALTAICVACALSTSAQVQTDTTTSTVAKPSKTTKVESGEVVYVSGNDLVVRMADGTIRHFTNVPESTRVTVDGQQLGIHDLKPGMKLQRTITTTTTPKMVKTVQSVTGTVFHVTPPLSVILTLDDGKNQEFKIPKGQKFDVNGTMTDAFGLRPGMKISATKVVEAPETVITQQAKITGSMPPPPPPPPPNVPILVVEEVAVVEQAAPAAPAEPAPTMPHTASDLPLIGLIGALALASSLGMRAFRSNQ